MADKISNGLEVIKKEPAKTPKADYRGRWRHEMNIVITISVIAVCVIVCLLIVSRFCKSDKERPLWPSIYSNEFNKIVEWSGDHSLFALLQCLYEEKDVCFDVIYFLDFLPGSVDAISKKTTIEDFNPNGFPTDIRPDVWFMHIYESGKQYSIDANTVVLCYLNPLIAKWNIEMSGHHWQHNRAVIRLKDRCNDTKEITGDLDDDSRMDWLKLITDTYRVIRNGNSVSDYNYRNLQEKYEKLQEEVNGKSPELGSGPTRE